MCVEEKEGEGGRLVLRCERAVVEDSVDNEEEPFEVIYRMNIKPQEGRTIFFSRWASSIFSVCCTRFPFSFHGCCCKCCCCAAAAAVEIVVVAPAALAAPVVVAAFAYAVVATSVAAVVDSAADVVAIASVAVASASDLAAAPAAPAVAAFHSSFPFLIDTARASTTCRSASAATPT